MFTRERGYFIEFNDNLVCKVDFHSPGEKVLFLNSGIIAKTKEVCDRVASVLPLGHVEIFFQFGTYVIPETGETGASHDGKVYITINPQHTNGLAKIVREFFPKTLAHELDHAVRENGVGYGDTLLEALVTEGLATRFEDELYPKPKALWGHALTDKQVGHFWKKAQFWLDKDDYNHDIWFFGKGPIPRWAGYTIGYRLVGDAMENLGTSAAELVNTPAQEILEASGWKNDRLT